MPAPQLMIPAGWRGDTSPDGYIRVQDKNGVPMTFFPLRSGGYNTNVGNNGGGGANAAITQNYASLGSPAGMGTSVLLKSGTGGTFASSGSCVLSFQFRGQFIGLVVTPKYQNNQNDLQGWIDGKYFSVNNNPEHWLDGTFTSQLGDGVYFVPIPVNLQDDGPHEILIYNPFNTDNATINQYQIYGVALETRLGIPAFQTSDYVINTAVTAQNTNVNVCGTSSSPYIVREIKFVNPSAVVESITINQDGKEIYTNYALTQNAPLIIPLYEAIYNGGGAGTGNQLIVYKSALAVPTAICLANIREK